MQPASLIPRAASRHRRRRGFGPIRAIRSTALRARHSTGGTTARRPISSSRSRPGTPPPATPPTHSTGGHSPCIASAVRLSFERGCNPSRPSGSAFPRRPPGATPPRSSAEFRASSAAGATRRRRRTWTPLPSRLPCRLSRPPRRFPHRAGPPDTPRAARAPGWTGRPRVRERRGRHPDRRDQRRPADGRRARPADSPEGAGAA